MGRPSKISYDIFLFSRVKNKIKLLGTESYPLHIRIRAAQKTSYRKSYLFSLLQQDKFQQENPGSSKTITIANIVSQETEILEYVIGKATPLSTPESIIHDYEFYSLDILYELDQRFCKFMVNFFNDESLPFYSAFVGTAGVNNTSAYLLESIARTLHPGMVDKLLQLAAQNGPPYIPVQAFHSRLAHGPLPVFQVYLWMQKNKNSSFSKFIKTKFPEYSVDRVCNYINDLITHSAASHSSQDIPN